VILFDVAGGTTSVPQGSSGGGVNGKNDFGKIGYGGPCPPAGKAHRYDFRVYALDVDRLGLAEGASRTDVERAMAGHAVGKGELVGLYAR